MATLICTHAEAGTESEKVDLIPENTSLWRESDLWDKELTVRAGIGYKDNVLLAPTAARGSAFFTSGLDMFLFRLPLDGLEFNVAITGDDVRYWRSVGVTHEDVFATSAGLKKYLEYGWQAGLEFRESYVDQVQYVILQTGPSVAQVEGHILQALPSIRRNFGTNWWAELTAEVSREYFAAPLDDSWQFGPRLVLGHSYGFGSSAALAYGIFHETHDSLPATDSGGNTLPGTKRALWKNDLELRWEHFWDVVKHWRSITRLGYHEEDDNGAGFFNYHGYSASEELRYQDSNWQLKCAGRVGYQDYYAQRTVPDLVASPKLNRSPLDLMVRAERRVYKSLKLNAQYEYEQTLSNLDSDKYRASTVSGGLSCAF